MSQFFRQQQRYEEEMRNAKRIIAAAVLSSPKRELRITPEALAEVAGPLSRILLRTYEDPRTGDFVIMVNKA